MSLATFLALYSHFNSPGQNPAADTWSKMTCIWTQQQQQQQNVYPGKDHDMKHKV